MPRLNVFSAEGLVLSAPPSPGAPYGWIEMWRRRRSFERWMSKTSERIRQAPVARPSRVSPLLRHPYREAAPSAPPVATGRTEDRALVVVLAFILICCLVRIVEAIGWSSGPEDEIVVALFGGWACVALLRRVR